MLIGDRLRTIRESKRMSQGDLEKRTGLLRCYLSRVERGHTVPTIETLEKWAAALQVPLYELFYAGEKKPILSELPRHGDAGAPHWGASGTQLSQLRKLRRSLSEMTDYERAILLFLARKIISSKRRAKSRVR
jgi:transcriptional regulator with XRE-family HTH domain